jgi:peptide/nickel transport system ATP-binding protein
MSGHERLDAGADAAAAPARAVVADAGEPLLLGVRDLRTSFRTSRGELQAVDGVSFELGAGRTLGIVGESGSGKSVLVRSVMRILPATATVSGDIRYRGRDLDDLSPAEARHFWGVEMAMVFQDPMTSLNPTKRVGRHISESLRYHRRMSGDAAERETIRLLDRVGLPAAALRARDYPHELSGGMRQRVVIAMALACDPRLLFADEPTTALDVTVQKQILDLLAALQATRQMGMVLITHDLGVVAGRTDDIAVMYAGRFVETAPTRQLFAEMRHPYTEALLLSIPRSRARSHTRLQAIPGRPPDLVGERTGCAFAPRCRYAQPRCVEEDPPLDGPPGSPHRWACFFPVGTEAGREALARNEAAGRTATGLEVRPEPPGERIRAGHALEGAG